MQLASKMSVCDWLPWLARQLPRFIQRLAGAPSRVPACCRPCMLITHLILDLCHPKINEIQRTTARTRRGTTNIDSNQSMCMDGHTKNNGESK